MTFNVIYVSMMIPCPMAKRLSRFRENTPFFSELLSAPGGVTVCGLAGRRGWGGEDLAWVCFPTVVSAELSSGQFVLQRSPMGPLLSLIPRHRVPAALTNVPRGYRLLCSCTGVSPNLVVFWGREDLWS